MLHIIWSIINAIIIFYLLYLVVGFIAKGKQIFTPQFKKVTNFIILVVIIQLVSASNPEKKANRIMITDDYDKNKDTTFKKVILEDNISFDINMLVIYSVEQNEFIPIESSSFLTGLVSGYQWEFKSIQTNNYEPNKNAEFTADGILKWNLFGINVYSESKNFKGIIN